MTSPVARTPTFLGVGAAKAGTTWLYECLREHPDVFMSDVKEVEYFSTRYERGFDWYREQFAAAGDARAVGEISPMYLIHPDAPQRIHAWNPEVKLLLVLRSPIDRAYSYYCMELRGCKVSDDVDRELVPGTRFLEEGLYHRHILHLLELFPREQIEILLYDDLKSQPHDFLRRVYCFVGVDDDFQPSLLDRPYHVRKSRPRSGGLLQRAVRLERWISRNPGGQRLVRTLRTRGLVDAFHALNKGPEFPTLSEAKRAELAEYYRADVTALSAFLGRDLDGWLGLT